MKTTINREQQARPASLILLMIALLFQGLSGIGGGIALIADPSGGILQMPVTMLQGSPFSDFLIPGIILFCVLGIFPLIVLTGLWMGRTWGWLGAILVGVALIIWIAVELLMVGYQPQPPLQVIYGLVGILILALVLLPGVRTHYSAR